MDFEAIYDEIARHARMDTGNTAHLANLKYWVNRAQDDVYAANPKWWFLKDEYTLTPVVGTRRYAFPATNVDSEAYPLALLDTDSVRVGTTSPLRYVSTDDLDNYDWDWVIEANSTGSPFWYTITGTKLALSKFPSAEWIAANPTIYIRGWSRLADMSEKTDESRIPDGWRQVLSEGGLWRAFRERGDSDWKDQRALFYNKLEEMKALCRSGHPMSGPVRAPLPFQFTGRRGSNVRD
jgi:hypothetical protein|tara:strand:+ start:2942 stop:3652 length:711 start_codon:yes stop_codon:yes gene_type:complete